MKFFTFRKEIFNLNNIALVSLGEDAGKAFIYILFSGGDTKRLIEFATKEDASLVYEDILALVGATKIKEHSV